MSTSVNSRNNIVRNLIMAMLKRKGSKTSMDAPLDISNKKRVPWICSVEDKGTIDCSSPKALMQNLLGETKIEDFLANFWEKKPLIVKRNDPKLYGSLFNHKIMKEILQTNEFEFHTDVSICHEKDFINELGRVTVERAEKLINEEKVGFQFYHPQRYIDELWKIIGELETYFGALVGSNAFVCPPDTKELNPHCEDVETFVMVIEGEVEWKLYKPMVELSRDFTQDLDKETIGQPTVTVTLQPGDLLYFPRGTIYQNKTTNKGNASFITVSTYLQNTWGDFMIHAVSKAIENGLENDVNIRSGLPINYLSFLGTGRNMSKYVEYSEDGEKEKEAAMYETNLKNTEVVEFKKNVQNYLSKLVEHIDVNMAADAMSQDFMQSRLPPYGHVYVDPCEIDENAENIAPSSDNVESENTEKSKKRRTTSTNTKLVSITDQIKIKYPEHIRLVYNDEEDDDLDSEIDSDDDTEIESEDEVMKDVEEKKKKTKSPGKPAKSPGKAIKKSTISEGDEDDNDDEADVDDSEAFIQISHSLHNDRFSHMGFSIFDEINVIKLDVTFTKAVSDLLNAKDYICVKDLLMDEEDEKLYLANRLASDGLLEIKS